LNDGVYRLQESALADLNANWTPAR